MQYFQILQLIITLLPLLVEIIKQVEELIPGRGKGEEKLAAVRTILESSYKVSTDAAVAFETIWPALEKAIAGLVSVLNAVGALKK
jgi:hypothetical protein